MKRTILTLATLMASTALALAEPALVYDMGGKNDKSFNEAAFNGAERYKEETGNDYRDFEVQNEQQRGQALRRFAEDGNNPIVAIGFSQQAAIEEVAQEFPDTDFAIIDSVVDQPNVRSIVFKEHEGSYLAGIMAAMASESNKVGFVGGMDIPLIRKFACGYKGGVKSFNEDAEVIENMTGTTPAAWGDPVKGGELAKSQIESGADVIFHAAGGTGIGVLQAAADAGKLGIGVDSNQNMLHPGNMLTSMIKRVDNAVFDAFTEAESGEFDTGIVALGVKEDGVGVAMDENNKDVVTPEMMEAVDAAKAKIASGELEVHDYMADSNCPY
ncbi:BMP family lipoprotein [Notoacmeibacter ruber]|uniref:BMP family ABC transporter substrate-binding protein n=1 Tax=Notoacmeibacter ruber TaxID=2670375 RepID=A0A3L7JIC4_9HYPH|nr:BMP family ABC transporter substrate-binding protein [Notoacmeibacter ruber]RLQ89381.1 BMP family ABC transporter substrate-binding protein [Notoacmeibacter ruber]